ncbi:guanine nucleotide binding protein alpha subunit [Penicillium angulare]|uniref:guanine nucleotide binding protein alpha subunit n=1 Tax=Penicillium angulare TaxID=116970 RepID=UPI0025419D4E|nr:guanine nucleotide binding protein alpha subunit [Penicillium angulare]XP_056776115.1 guanine nucleotide binding protein alpha subunit [Penicillium angulare]KAJ5267334.1 guanine nucleotide binding protein alpha subunit [Penicillium angulare]KAJ5267723.1 guanine nucleotide binding protein alpha subunit [Penicillium angulare]
MEYFKHGIIGCMSLSPTVDTDNEEAVQHSAKIDKFLKSEKKSMARTTKILLLGAGESGKSTIIKQMRILYSGGFSEDERCQTRVVIYSSIVIAFKIVLGIMSAENIDFEIERAKSSANFIDKIQPDMNIDRPFLDVCNAMKDLWKDPGVQKAIARSRRHALHDNLLYFYNSIDRISAPGWLPDNQDMLQARLRTTGISESFFGLGCINWRMIDVGGQRSERRKWIHCFEDVGCLIFVVALSGYDQSLVEDQNANQMHEAMMLFDPLANGKWFKRKPIILFLNKIDLFKEKLVVSPLSQYFPDFTGSNIDFGAAAGYFTNRFHGINRTRDREIYVHYTNATDSTLLKATMDSVQDMIIQKNLCSLNL